MEGLIAFILAVILKYRKPLQLTTYMTRKDEKRREMMKNALM